MSELGHRLEEALHDIEEHIPFYLRRWWRWPAIGVAAVVVPIALGLGLFRVIAPLVPGYTEQVEQRASALLGWPVAIEGMYLSWHRFGPEVVLQKVQLRDPTRSATLLTAETVRIAVGPTDFLRGGEWRPNRVLFERPELSLTVTADQRVLLGGTVIGDLTAPTADWRGVLDRLLTHGRIEVSDAIVFWHDQRRNDGPLGFAAAFLLDTDGKHHKLDLDLALPTLLGRRLHVEAVAEGVPARPESWRWTGHVKGTALNVGWLHARLDPDASHGFAGSLDLDASMGAEGWRLDTLDGRVAMSALVATSSAPGGAAVGAGIDALESGVRWRRTDAGWALDLVRLSVRRAASSWQPGGLHLEYATDFVSPAKLTGRAGFLRVEDLELIASWLPAALLPVGPRLHALAPHGSISALEFTLALEAGSVVDYDVAADFDALGFERQGRAPGINGLRGKLRARRDGGTLALDARDLSFDFGDLFRGPLGLRTLRGDLSWTRTPDGWFLQGSDLALRNSDARAIAHFTLLLPGDGRAPVIDLEAKVNDAIAGNQRAYFPVRVMSPGLVAWLDRAIVAGRAPVAEILLQGPLDHYPFRDGSGLFQVKFHAEDAVLDYGVGWPRIEGIVADVTFRNAGLEVVASSANIFGASSKQARAWIVDHADPVVHVEGRVGARAEQALEFLRSSPLKATLGDYLGALDVQGPVDFGLNLTIDPHHEGPGAFKAQIDAKLAGARVALKGLPIVAEEVAGTVRFTEATVASDAIEGRLFGAPFNARIGPAPRGTRALARLKLSGGFEARALARAVELPLDGFLRGQAQLGAEVDLPTGGSALVARLSSDLRGVAVTLPPPFAKPAPERVAARATLQFTGREALATKVEYGSGSVANYAMTRSPGGWELADGEGAAQISVVAPVVDLDAWLAAWTAPVAAQSGKRAAVAPPLRRLDVHAQKLLLVGSPVSDAHITARRDGPGWQLEVASAAVAGSVSVPDDRAATPITLDMERLWLGEPSPDKLRAASSAAPADAGAARPTSERPVDPRTLPALAVRAGSLRLLGADLGAVEATIERRPSGLFMTRFVGKALTHSLEGTGSWEQVDAVQRSRLDVTLISTDARVTLTSLGLNAPLEAKRARLVSKLDWPGAPWQEPFAHVDGSIEVRIAEGQLIEIAPGAGRLVGLMSLNALPRRLKLDFRDVYKKGLAFDSVEGDFHLEDGNAYTTGARIKSPAATVTILGRAGLGARDYDQIAVVETGLGSSLPVAGAIAGGLPGAAVMLLVSQVFKSSLDDASKAQYRITGSWDDPKVERVQGKLAPPPTAGKLGPPPAPNKPVTP